MRQHSLVWRLVWPFLIGAMLLVNYTVTAGASEGADGCNPNRETDYETYRWDGWQYPAEGNSTTPITGATVYTNTYSPYVPGPSADYVSAWSMLTVDTTVQSYAQIGYMEFPGNLAGGTQRFLMVDFSTNGAETGGAVPHTAYPAPQVGSFHTYTTLYDNTDGGLIPPNSVSFQYDGNVVLQNGNPYYAQISWTPAQAQIMGETHTAASQMEGDVSNPEYFEDSGYYENGAWHAMNSTGNVQFVNDSPNSSGYGAEKLSSNDLAIWDWACPTNIGRTGVAWYLGGNSAMYANQPVPGGGGIQLSYLGGIAGISNLTWAGSGDFLGNGNQQIAWYDSATRCINMLIPNSSGFTNQNCWLSGMGPPNWAGVGDFSGNGKADIAWYQSWNNGAITLYDSTGSSFTPIGNMITGMGTPTWAGVGYFAHTNIADIAWYESWYNNGTISMLSNTGSNTLSNVGSWYSGQGAPYQMPSGYAAAGVAQLGSSSYDTVYMYRSTTDTIWQFNSNGSSFTPRTAYAAGIGPMYWIGSGDYNGGGVDDIALLEGNPGNLVVLANWSGGGIAPAVVSSQSMPTWGGMGNFFQ